MAKAVTAETKPAKSKNNGKTDKPNVFARLAQYFRDVRSEMKRVVWPQRPEIINSSMVVLVTLIFFVALTFTVDLIVVEVVQLLTKLG